MTFHFIYSNDVSNPLANRAIAVLTTENEELFFEQGTIRNSLDAHRVNSKAVLQSGGKGIMGVFAPLSNSEESLTPPNQRNASTKEHIRRENHTCRCLDYALLSDAPSWRTVHTLPHALKKSRWRHSESRLKKRFYADPLAPSR